MPIEAETNNNDSKEIKNKEKDLVALGEAIVATGLDSGSKNVEFETNGKTYIASFSVSEKIEN